MPLVLVQNEVTVDARFGDFDNVTGEQYQFMDRYRSKVVPGSHFVYYRGTRRADGSRRKTGEYFGCGRVGEVWRDMHVADGVRHATGRSYCVIEDYEPFTKPVPAVAGGKAVEGIATNLFGVSVRSISERVYEVITRLGRGACGKDSPEGLQPHVSVAGDGVLLSADQDLWAKRSLAGVRRGAVEAEPRLGVRPSAYAKWIGDQAEEVVLRLLERVLDTKAAGTLRWVAREGEKPGWDIEYIGDDGSLVGVEVKGTAGPVFSTIEWTENERRAASRLGAHYRLYLVAECTSAAPKVQVIRDPARAVSDGGLVVEPLVWRLGPA